MNLNDLPNKRSDAIDSGNPFYYTGKPCKNGHICKRLTKNWSCHLCQLESDKRSRNKRINKRREQFKEWYYKDHNKSKKVLREKSKQKRQIEKFKLDDKIHRGITRKLHLVKKDYKNRKTKYIWESYVNFSFDELINHLEKQFDSNMSWENYGNYWWLDHIKPKSKCGSLEEAWELSNLQPLEAQENRIKSNKCT